MRGKAGLDIEKAITELGVGEALVSMLDAKGRPSETEQVYVLLPGSQLGPITPEQRQTLLANSLVAGVYEQVVDRESAYERLKGVAPAAASGNGAGNGVGNTAAGAAPANTSTQAPAQPSVTDQVLAGLGDALFGSTGPRLSRCCARPISPSPAPALGVDRRVGRWSRTGHRPGQPALGR